MFFFLLVVVVIGVVVVVVVGGGGYGDSTDSIVFSKKLIVVSILHYIVKIDNIASVFCTSCVAAFFASFSLYPRRIFGKVCCFSPTPSTQNSACSVLKSCRVARKEHLIGHRD